MHASLLTDYYPPAHHPRVFALHRLANPIGLSSALVIGLLASFFDWRLVFLSLCVPTFLPAAGGRSSFLEARRVLFRVRTLRRLWIGLPVVGIALITLPQLISVFFERVYGYGPTGRGVVTFLSGVGIVLGLTLGQRLATRALAAGRPELLATYDGLAIAGIGVALLGLVLSPWAELSAFCYLLAGIGSGTYQPNYFSLVALVRPAGVRAQAYAWAILFLGVGAISAPLLDGLAESEGYRLAIGVLAVTLLAGGAVATTARSAVRKDAEAARAQLTAHLEPPPVPVVP